VPGFLVEDHHVLQAPSFFEIGAKDEVGVALQCAHEPLGRGHGEPVILLGVALEIALEGEAGAGELLQQRALVDVLGDIGPAAREQAGDRAALRGEDNDPAFVGPVDQAVESGQPAVLPQVGDERADPDQVELGGEGQLAQVGSRVDRRGAELFRAEVDTLALEIAGCDLRVAVVGAQPAQHPAVAAGQVENGRVVRLVAEDR